MSQSSYDAKTEINIQGLEPVFAAKVRKWLAIARVHGLNPYIFFGYRTPAEQAALHQKFVTGQGPRAVAPKASYHCYGLAFDWVPIKNPDASGDTALDWDNDQAYRDAWALAEPLGIRGIGEIDNDHIQDSRFDTWEDLPDVLFGNPHAKANPDLSKAA